MVQRSIQKIYAIASSNFVPNLNHWKRSSSGSGDRSGRNTNLLVL